MKISEVEARLEELKQQAGDVDVRFCNYEEETVEANVTDINLSKGAVVMMCTEGGEMTQMEDNTFNNYSVVER